MRKNLFLILLLIVPFALGETIQEESFPINFTMQKNVTLQNNSEIYVERFDQNIIDVDFPEKIVLKNRTGATLNFTNVFTEKTYNNRSYDFVFKITNNVSSSEVYYNYSIFVEALPLIEDEKDFFIHLTNGVYVVNITTNFLPKEGSLLYDLRGLAGRRMNISCEGRWVTCPEYSLFNDSGRTNFSIDYFIPLDAPLGENIVNVSLTSGNATANSTIKFIVRDPDISLQSYVWTDKCYKFDANGNIKLESLMECVREQEEFEKKRLEQAYNRMYALLNKTCPEPETKYVVTGNIEDEVMEQLRLCQDTRNTLQDKANSCNTDYQLCNREYNALVKETLNNESERNREMLQTSARALKESSDEKKRAWRIFWWAVITVILIILITLGVLKLRKEGFDWRWSYG
ncbi:MAG: hypothetical protein ACE5RP_00050 [Nitrosopumilus sp.]